jgi:hypothetical protein
MRKEQLWGDDSIAKDSCFSYKDYAKRELEILYPQPDAAQRKEIEHIIKIMEIVDGIDDFISKYMRLMPCLFQQRPLTPLTGADDEWLAEAVEDGLSFTVNKRAFDVVKHNGKAFWLGGKVFSDDGGKTFRTTSDSYVPIESFPFRVPFAPEFIINPTDDEVAALETEMDNKNMSI